MIDSNDIKEAANPYAQLTKAANKHAAKTDTVITLLGAICDVIDANLLVNQDILKEKKENHAAWIKATNKRFYISLAAVMVTGAVLYLDVLKLNEDSEIVGGIVTTAKAIAGLFL